MEKKKSKIHSHLFKNPLVYLIFGIIFFTLFYCYLEFQTEIEDKLSHDKILEKTSFNLLTGSHNLNLKTQEGREILTTENSKTQQDTIEHRNLEVNLVVKGENENQPLVSEEIIKTSTQAQSQDKQSGFQNNLSFQSPGTSTSIPLTSIPSNTLQIVEGSQNYVIMNSDQHIQAQLKQVNLEPAVYQIPTLQDGSISGSQLIFARSLSNLQTAENYQELIDKEKSYYEQKYKISSYDEQPFCIFVPSFNNVAKDRYLLNLNSIFQQDYSNYRIIFIDDASTDGTGQQVKRYAANHQISQQKLKIIVNQKRKMAMPNIYKAAHQFCKPHEIFMIIDGDDELIGKQIFKLYNALFQNRNYWLVYTNFITMNGGMGYSRPYAPYIIQQGQFRKAGFVISHLRAFYTKLFTLISEKDLKDEEGNWFRAANDVAMYMPILEMARQKFSYVPQVCYLYNSNTGLNNHIVKNSEQRGNQYKIKEKKSYPALIDLFTLQQKLVLKESLNKKIPIKDLNLPLPQGSVQQYKWELDQTK